MISDARKIAAVEARLDNTGGITLRPCPYKNHIGSDMSTNHSGSSYRFFHAKFTEKLYFELCLNHLHIAERHLIEAWKE
jgi:hypothetical protein